MASYPCNPGLFEWGGNYGGSFRPKGKVVASPDNLGRTAWTADDTLAARIIVGFNVGENPRYDLDDLMVIVRRVREAQTGDPSASFISQRGIYKHQDPTHGVVQEDGGQVLIIDMGESAGAFEKHMIELAETIAREMQQEMVILEIQRNGVTERTHGITPD